MGLMGGAVGGDRWVLWGDAGDLGSAWGWRGGLVDAVGSGYQRI